MILKLNIILLLDEKTKKFKFNDSEFYHYTNF